MFYGSILIKLYRILTEFQTRKAHRVCLRDKDQMAYLSAIVLIVVGYMSAWTALMTDGFYVLRLPADDDIILPDTMPSSATINLNPPELSATTTTKIEPATETGSWPSAVAAPTATMDALDLFGGLLERELRFEAQSSSLVVETRCRKFTWDYVTESSKYCCHRRRRSRRLRGRLPGGRFVSRSRARGRCKRASERASLPGRAQWRADCSLLLLRYCSEPEVSGAPLKRKLFRLQKART